LFQEGVSIKAVEAALRGLKVPRSSTTILVKNLPATVDDRLLRERFSRFGTLSRVVLAPSRIVGLVEFCDAGAAKYVSARSLCGICSYVLYVEL
jgi:multiple RNA-binding domain-containing protein 1